LSPVARPDGNATGVNLLSLELVAKRLELLREMVPGAVRVAVLVNPANAAFAETTLKDAEPAARAMGLQIQVLNASTSGEIDAAFATLVRQRPDALFVGNDPFFTSRRVQLATAAAHHSILATFGSREIAEAGGLMSYGSNIADAWHQLGAYVGRVLKGAKPAELPVVQSSKFELVINAQTARTLGLEIPPTLLARADEVIEFNGWRSTPGTTPLTSQLVLLISTTTTKVEIGSNAARLRLRSLTCGTGQPPSVRMDDEGATTSAAPPHSFSHLGCVTAKTCRMRSSARDTRAWL
jgi:ABC transporter substrate binding protein